MHYNNKTKYRFFLSGRGLIGLLLLFIPLIASAQDNSSINLQSNSQRCVALRQGQTCYKKLKIHWQAPQVGNYCIYALNVDTPLQCWRQQSNADFTLEFESESDTTYVLRRENQSTNLAELTITVSWVYEPKTQGNRRLF